jgi:hypothetical protein
MMERKCTLDLCQRPKQIGNTWNFILENNKFIEIMIILHPYYDIIYNGLLRTSSKPVLVLTPCENNKTSLSKN